MTPLDRKANELRLMGTVTKSGNITSMPRTRVSPIGTSVSADIRRQEKTDPAYRSARKRLARAESIARLLIQFRMEHDLTQEELAQLMGISAPAISRLESGTHVPSLTTLSRLAAAAGEQLIIGFEKTGAPSRKRERTIVAV